MKISIIGGGPAGLYFALLMKQRDRSQQITVYERNGANDTFGWGVVFSGKTLAHLREADAVTHDEIAKNFAAWDNVDIVHRNKRITISGNRFSGIRRLKLLNILQMRCHELGVDLRFNTEIKDFNSLSDSDLIIGADGVNSPVRASYKEFFQPVLSLRPNKYIWYGTRQLFHGLTLTFRQTEAGTFSAHSYKFDLDTSTFIVECDRETWERAGFENMTDLETRRALEEVFRKDLDGHELLSNNSKWINFLLVKNGRWNYRNIVLLGDALHTAHFSIGSGTKLALEDAIALTECFDNASTIESALAEFESRRRPVIEEYQSAAYESLLWFENACDYMHLSPIELAYSLMMRSKRISHESLRRRDPAFVAQYERAVGDKLVS
jgi:anthraniloyl-CoA monooxygenase